MADLDSLKAAIDDFSRERDWDQFHSPKNLVMAMSVEVAELVEHFQWLTEAQSLELNQHDRENVADEIADVFIYLLRLANKLEIDPVDAAWKKLAKNAEKYPIEKSKGVSTKYDRFS